MLRKVYGPCRVAARRTRARKQANVTTLQDELRKAAQDNDILSAHIADLSSQVHIHHQQAYAKPP